MSSHKTLALALCLAITGCAQNPQKDTADSGHSWWPFGSDKVADQEVKAAVNEKVAATEAKSEGGSWWWPFGGSDDKAVAKAAVPKIDVKATQAWLDAYEPRLRAGLEDRAGVARQPERAVHVDRAGPLQRGAQQIDDPVTHDRIVHVREP